MLYAVLFKEVISFSRPAHWRLFCLIFYNKLDFIGYFRYRSRRSGSGNRGVETLGGKSGHHRAECQLTAGRCEPTESATENRPPMAFRRTGKGETVR